MKKIYMMPQTEVVSLKTDYCLMEASGEVSGTSVKMNWNKEADESETLGRTHSIWDDVE